MQTPDPLRRAHTIPEVCALTGIGRDTVYAVIRDGHLVARKLGRRTLVTDDDLRAFLNSLPRLDLTKALIEVADELVEERNELAKELAGVRRSTQT